MNYQQTLRDLSQRLDIHFGVHVRKTVMAGHEQLSLAKCELYWSQWIDDVAVRLDSLTEVDPAKKVMDVQYIRLLNDNPECCANQN